MHDKTIRRRRAVLIALVALSLILLTAYFGEAPNGRLHSVQRDFLAVVSPIQDGANKALKPVRDLFGWFSSTLHAKSQVAELRKQNDRLRAQLIERQGNERAYAVLKRLYHLDGELSVSAYHPVTATVIGQLPEPVELDDRHQPGDVERGSGQRSRDRRRRPRRQGHALGAGRRAGEPDHRQRLRGHGRSSTKPAPRASWNRRWAIPTIC